MRPALLLVPLLLTAAPASALPRAKAQRLLHAARALHGVEYDFGGRLQKGRGIDCQGVLFFAAEALSPCGWRSYSVMPTVSVRDRELGSPVPGLSPVATEDLDVSALEPGDVLWLVGFAENPAEPALAAIAERPVWVWHTALYAGDGAFLHADFFTGEVREEPLKPFLERHEGSYAGIFVTRMGRGPSPRRCRRHSPLRERLEARQRQQRRSQ